MPIMSYLTIIKNKRLNLTKFILFFRKFIFNKKKYSYFIHPYNATFSNERIVEVPIILNEINKLKNSNILEIGNVLSHYVKIKHTVVDKYEKAPGVINEDIVSYKPKSKFDLIVAISTLEHVGYDEAVKDPKKIIKVLKRLTTFLNKKGKLIFTVPISYNKILDKQIIDKKLPAMNLYFLTRNSKFNTWIETDSKNAFTKKYNKPFSNANAILVGEILK